MRLVYRGNYAGEDQLPKGELPAGAVPFQEPEDPAQLNRAAGKFGLAALAVAGLIAVATVPLRGGVGLRSIRWMLLGSAASLVTILPHELLHGLCFGRGAVVELFLSLKNLMAFVVCTRPISRGRFVWMSLLPNLVFGWLPFLAWACLPYRAGYSDFLFGFSLLCISFGCGDYLNVWNALGQMPRGSMQQLSGFHSYWFLP